VSFGDFCEGDGIADVGNPDGDSFALVSAGDDDDEAAFDAGDAVALITDGFDFGGTLIAFFDRRFWLLMSVLCRFWRRFGCRCSLLAMGGSRRDTLPPPEDC
jgi:hypothetical protein